MRAACSRPRSSSKCSSGMVRVESAFAILDRRNPAALLRPSRARAASSSLVATPSPRAITNTLACDKSPLTSTRVRVISPTRGSRMSRASASASTWRTISATCPGRRLGLLATATASGRGAGGGLERPLDLFDAERLDSVAHLEIVEVLHPDPALQSLAHFLHVVLEALEAGDGPGIHQGAVPHHPDLGGALNDAGAHRAAGDGADLADLEDLEHLGLAQHRLALLRLEQALQRRAHVLHRLVDDAIGADVHPF